LTNPAMQHLTRHERRDLLDREARRRKSGVWGDWEIIELPNGVFSGKGWPSEVRQIRKNHVFSLLVRPLRDGNAHLAISSLSGVRPSWREMQRIKNEILGEQAVAIEIYPPAAEMVDEADMFHIWGGLVLPPDFTIFSRGD